MNGSAHENEQTQRAKVLPANIHKALKAPSISHEPVGTVDRSHRTIAACISTELWAGIVALVCRFLG